MTLDEWITTSDAGGKRYLPFKNGVILGYLRHPMLNFIFFYYLKNQQTNPVDVQWTISGDWRTFNKNCGNVNAKQRLY